MSRINEFEDEQVFDAQSGQGECFESWVACKAFNHDPGTSVSGRTRTCAQHMFAAYLTVLYGLQNVLLLDGALMTDKAAWKNVLREVPADYEAMNLAGACTNTAVDDMGLPIEMLCPRAYMLSQIGARSLLRGLALVLRNLDTSVMRQVQP